MELSLLHDYCKSSPGFLGKYRTEQRPAAVDFESSQSAWTT